MKNDLSICVTTFKQRKDLVRDLIHKIKSLVPNDVDIILLVNGNNEEKMPNDYRRDMLQMCYSYDNIYPIICAEFKSLSKLWNTGVIFSGTEYNLVLSDDVEFLNPNAYQQIVDHIKNSDDEFFTIGHQFSQFVCSKSILHELGYFDERFSAFGEEDGDIHYRYKKMFGSDMPVVFVDGIWNKGAYSLSSENLETHIDNKPKLNREVFKLMYEINESEGIPTRLSPDPLLKTKPDIQQYPYEKFVRNNAHNIAKFDKVIFDD